MESMIDKYKSLPLPYQQEVNDFIEFVLMKAKAKKRFTVKDWRQRITNVSVWSEKDIQVMKKNSKGLSLWKPPQW